MWIESFHCGLRGRMAVLETCTVCGSKLFGAKYVKGNWEHPHTTVFQSISREPIVGDSWYPNDCSYVNP